MHFLPIVARELSVASKRPATYRIRVLGAAITGALAFAIITRTQFSPAMVGQEVFGFLSVLAFIYALLSGVWSTADSISEEKREGTLGLLFLTNLRGWDVVTGKLAANALDVAYGLIATLPLLGLPVLLGAVTGSQFARMVFLLLNTLVLSAIAGLVVSTFARQEREGLVATFFVMLFLALGLPGLWQALGGAKHSRFWDYLLLFPSPAYGFRMVSDGNVRLASHEYHLCMATMAGLSVVGLIIASYALPRMLQEEVRTVERGEASGAFIRWRYADGAVGTRPPFLWLLTRDRLPNLWLGGLLLLIFGFTLWFPGAFRPQRSPATPIAMFGAFGLHLIVKLLLTCEAARRLNDDKRTGALELLLGTPLAVTSILGQQEQALARRFGLLVILLVLLNLVFLSSLPQGRDDLWPVALGGAIVAPFDAVALSWVAMLTALRESRFIRAVLRAIAAVLVLPWAAFFFFILSQPRNQSTVLQFFFWWFVGIIVFDLAMIRWAKNQLLTRFRRFAANDPRPPRLLNLGPPPSEPAVLADAGSGRSVA